MSKPPKQTALERAMEAWGSTAPAEVIALAEYADALTASKAANAIGYSPSVVSYILSNTYTGSIADVFERIRGALLGEAVACPELGELRRDQCLDTQRRPFAATNAARARVFRACRSGCPHSRLKGA